MCNGQTVHVAARIRHSSVCSGSELDELFECISHGGALGVQKLNSATALIQRQPRRLPHAEYVLHRRAIAAAKKKNDRIDANKIADCLRCDFLPECYVASTEIRERRRTLRYRNLLVHQAVQLKNEISGLLMEAGVSYNKQKLHKVGYFKELLATNPDIHEG